MHSALLTCRSISKSHQRTILNQVSLQVKAGEIHVIIGKSGAGKSTLLKILSGLQSSDEGEVLFEGEKLANPQDQLLPGHEELAYVAQDFKLLPNRTVIENLKDALLPFNEDFTRQQISKLLSLMNLDEVQHRRIELLSGGEKQRLAIARAMATEPAVLLLDEPFTQLDLQTRKILLDALKEVNSALNTAIVFVSHNSYEAFYLAHQVHVLVEGRLMRSDVPKSIYRAPEHLDVAKLLGEINLLQPEQSQIKFSGKYGIWPEDVHIIAHKVSKKYDFTFEGRLVDCVFMGQFYRSRIRLPSGQEMIAAGKEEISIPLDEKVIIGIYADKLMELSS